MIMSVEERVWVWWCGAIIYGSVLRNSTLASMIVAITRRGSLLAKEKVNGKQHQSVGLGKEECGGDCLWWW